MYVHLDYCPWCPCFSRVHVAGLVLPMVAQQLFGRSGEMIMVVMIVMAVVSTGSAEVVAVTSILVYDIYMLYLKVGTCTLRHKKRIFKFYLQHAIIRIC